MKCLDTDFLVGVLKGIPEAKTKLGMIDKEGRAATTAITAFELLNGARLSKNVEENINATLRLLSRLEVLYFDLESADFASQVFSELSTRGNLIDERDLFIASICISKGLVLVTRNTKHFSRIKMLKIESW